VSYLRLENIQKHYGAVSVVHGVSLAAKKGEFVVFVGPSGCGKSTLLRMVAGLEEVSSGDIFIDGARVTDTEPAKRQVSMVFQSYALFPHMSVRDNIAFGLKMSKTPKVEIDRQVAEAARILQMEALLDRKPRQLSGGQRQRVAIGRAIVRHPKLFLFDEPLSNLDAELRAQMRVEIARLHRDLGVTMIYVTHDQMEAMTLADRIVVLRAGRVEQIGSPQDLYDKPANTFVAGFIGSPKMNFITVKVVELPDGAIEVAHPSLTATVTIAPRNGHAATVKAGDEVTLGLRPEHILLGEGPNRIDLKADLSESLGGSTLIYGQTVASETVNLQTAGRRVLAKGEPFTVGFSADHAYLFDKAGQAL
jgi:multiple sugar transport system ATP-binding protein/lactose/L-arabinose transport system ATP-binding protein